MSDLDEPLLILKEITKIYPNKCVANRQINLTIKKGRVHVILGENGAGKTTLMNILFGLIQPTSGEMKFRGKEQRFLTTADAIKAGIGMVQQHFKLVPSLSLLENCFLGIESKKFFFTNNRKMRRVLNDFLVKYDLNLPTEKKAKDCSASVQQLIEIVKTLIRGADLIIMDEPTSLLTPQERDSLFNIISKLKGDGKTIILITHKLKEAMMIGDSLTIMSQGKVLNSFDRSNDNPKECDLIRQLFHGSSKSLPHSSKDDISNEEVLRFLGINLQRKNIHPLKDLSFSLRRGEILGFAGMAESGQREIIEMITGYQRSYSGDFQVYSRPVKHHSPRKARGMNISYIPSDRLNLGSDGNLKLWENCISTQLDSSLVGSRFKLRKRNIFSYVSNLIKQFSIKALNPFVKVEFLSGGNIQKMILARELSTKSEIIVADNPTRGVDIQSAEFIREQLYAEKIKGKAILLFSYDLDELIELSDRIIVLFEGRIIDMFDKGDNLSEYKLGACMLGKGDGMIS